MKTREILQYREHTKKKIYSKSNKQNFKVDAEYSQLSCYDIYIVRML